MGGAGREKESSENDQLSSYRDAFFQEKNSKTNKGKPTVCIKSLNISSFSEKPGQDNHF